MGRIKFRNVILGVMAGCVALVLASFAIAGSRGLSPGEFVAIMRDAASRRVHRKTAGLGDRRRQVVPEAMRHDFRRIAGHYLPGFASKPPELQVAKAR